MKQTPLILLWTHRYRERTNRRNKGTSNMLEIHATSTQNICTLTFTHRNPNIKHLYPISLQSGCQYSPRYEQPPYPQEFVVRRKGVQEQGQGQSLPIHFGT